VADFGSPVAQGVDVSPTKGIQTLSDLIGLKQKQQTLETGQYLQQSAQATAQQDQQSAQQRSGLANFMQSFNPSKHVGADGTLDLDAVMTDPKLRQAAGDQFPQIMQSMIQAKQGQLTAKQQLADLSGTLRGQFSSTVGSLRTDPDVVKDDPATGMGRAKVKDAIQGFAESGGPDAARVANTYGSVIDHVPQGKLAQTLSNFQLQAVDAGHQAATQAPNLTDTGAQLQNINPQAAGGNLGVQPPIAKVTPPAIMQAPSGSIVRVPAGGAGLPTLGAGAAPGAAAAPGRPAAPPPRSAADDAPPPNAPRAVQEAYAVATKRANDHLEEVRNADESYGNNKAISSAVRRLASDASTGPGTETWNHAMGVLNTKGANNYQELGAFLDRQAATVRGQMGLPGTNAGAEDAKMIAGNTQYNAKVIQDKNDYTESLTEGLHQYRNGLDRVGGFSGQASPNQIAKFKSAWTNAFDPNVYIGENAYKRSKADGDKFVASLDPKEAASLSEKRKALNALAAGKMP
jgi:hypothetical protein